MLRQGAWGTSSAQAPTANLLSPKTAEMGLGSRDSLQANEKHSLKLNEEKKKVAAVTQRWLPRGI